MFQYSIIVLKNTMFSSALSLRNNIKEVDTELSNYKDSKQ